MIFHSKDIEKVFWFCPHEFSHADPSIVTQIMIDHKYDIWIFFHLSGMIHAFLMTLYKPMLFDTAFIFDLFNENVFPKVIKSINPKVPNSLFYEPKKLAHECHDNSVGDTSP